MKPVFFPKIPWDIIKGPLSIKSINIPILFCTQTDKHIKSLMEQVYRENMIVNWTWLKIEHILIETGHRGVLFYHPIKILDECTHFIFVEIYMVKSKIKWNKYGIWHQSPTSKVWERHTYHGSFLGMVIRSKDMDRLNDLCMHIQICALSAHMDSPWRWLPRLNTWGRWYKRHTVIVQR